MRSLSTAVVAMALAVAGTAQASHPAASIAPVDLLVIAPHPDDEALMAAGVIATALKQGERVAVAIVTNGDKGCERDGYARQAESVAALAKLGVKETDLYFLGYPDGHLAELSPVALTGVLRRDAAGGCVAFETTWAVHGRFGTDLHRALEGASAPLTSSALEADLAALLTHLRPKDVFLPHPIDAHPDHAAVYRFVRRAIDSGGSAPRTLHRAVIHARGCWPAADCERPVDLDAPVAPLPSPLSGYLPDERLAADAKQKLAVIATYESQLEAPLERSWLASFARPVEPFFTETLQHTGTGWVPTGGAGVTQVVLPLEACGRARVPAGGGEYRLEWKPPSLELSFRSGEHEAWVASWPLPQPPAGHWRLRFSHRPDLGTLSELSLYGPEGFSGEAIISGLPSPGGPPREDCSDPRAPAPASAPR